MCLIPFQPCLLSCVSGSTTLAWSFLFCFFPHLPLCFFRYPCLSVSFLRRLLQPHFCLLILLCVPVCTTQRLPVPAASNICHLSCLRFWVLPLLPCCAPVFLYSVCVLLLFHLSLCVVYTLCPLSLSLSLSACLCVCLRARLSSQS